MQLVRYQLDGEAAYGAVVDRVVFRLESGRSQSRLLGPEMAPLDRVVLLAPCEPTKIVAVGRNYAAHAAEHGAEVPSEPLLFLKPPSSVIGPDAPIVYPEGSTNRVDHEAELAVILGRRAYRVPKAEAYDYVLGYTCANDVTARDLQQRDGQWTRSKSFDTFCPLGPWIATELDITDLSISCFVNGELRQAARTSAMIFAVDELIAYITSVMTLQPGDVILTGTPEGVSPLRPGDRVTVEIEGIGALHNEVRGHG